MRAVASLVPRGKSTEEPGFITAISSAQATQGSFAHKQSSGGGTSLPHQAQEMGQANCFGLLSTKEAGTATHLKTKLLCAALLLPCLLACRLITAEFKLTDLVQGGERKSLGQRPTSSLVETHAIWLPCRSP